ncbi:hypothetical protein [Campylobacter phage CP39]|nr:hypothetical protein [Campylobacter phage CP39]
MIEPKREPTQDFFVCLLKEPRWISTDDLYPILLIPGVNYPAEIAMMHPDFFGGDDIVFKPEPPIDPDGPDLSNYYTKPETNSLLDKKADKIHTHVVADITDLNLDKFATKEETYTKQEIDDKIDEIVPPEIDLTDYAKKDAANIFTKANTFTEAPSVEVDATLDNHVIRKKQFDNSIKEVKDLLSNVFSYKGSKPTYTEIEAIVDKKIGDVWYAEDTGYMYMEW